MDHITPDYKTSNTDFALSYAATRKWAIFPVPLGTKKSYKSARYSKENNNWGATRKPAQIRQDFAKWPKAGIGIPTGPDNGIVVIETDTKAGGHAVDGEPILQRLQRRYGPLPATLTAISPSGSKHRYFKHPGPDVEITSKTLVAGVDIKGNGGMVIAPPTERAGLGRYRWDNDLPIAPLPLRWLRLISKQPPPQYVPTTPIYPQNSDRYGRAALESEIAKLELANDGFRNAALNCTAFKLFQLVDLGKLQDAEVVARLIRACEVNGLMYDRENGGPKKINDTIESARTGARRKPRCA